MHVCRIQWVVGALGLLAMSLCWVADSRVEGAEPKIDFIRQIRPILSDRCFRCHGPDDEERQAGLRLDLLESAMRPAESGAVAVVPGDVERSELLKRIDAAEADQRMPPEHSQKTLTADERRLLRDWVAQGASYAQHWAFVPPVRPAVPDVQGADWPRTPIDAFLLAKMGSVGLRPQPPADRGTWIRRVTLDLTGLPPTPAEVDEFLSDASPTAYERVVDRLLASPHFGERMALEWLDAARFADTNGYHLDNGRDMSAWRAWVIDAFNANLPFDQFTVEQLAGDLLPEPSTAQLVASGFNRNHMINFEGGAIPDEYQNAYIVDRVNTTSTVWLGLTVACAQCHDHKFDPISQRDFYRLYAFFNSVPENGLDGNRGNAAPMLKLPTAEQQAALDRLRADLQAAEEKLNALPQDSGDQQPLRDQVASLQKELEQLEGSLPTTMIMGELPEPRATFVLMRGQYDKRGQQVSAGVPESIAGWDAELPSNRLGLARWLVSDRNPLTARVIVNRYWQMLFGTGLVKTAEDFGSQGELPSHPELLDWLAVEFQEGALVPAGESPRWNVKRLIKLMVMSAAYQQSAIRPAADRQIDPENRYLAAGPRFRLPAELIRDQALAVSGLLKHRIGGPSVNPYQPEGLWSELSQRGDSGNWTAQFFKLSEGEDLYRRSMYTFWKRTCPPPQMSTFDAPDRETCTVRRARTNTPLQSLILMNDPTYVEASRKLAERLMHESAEPAIDRRIDLAFRLVLARPAQQAELEVLRGLYQRQLDRYRGDSAATDELLHNGQSPVDDALDRSELAALTMLASALLNLDETVTRP
ncbi:MAG: PSD1 and planctomycete cytochrome C domain-containing protein [Pirellulales bacterium]